MPIRFRCAYCNQLMGIARRKAGTVVRCPTCSGQVVVPSPEAAPPDLVEPSPPPPQTQPRGPGLFERSDFGDELFQNAKPGMARGSGGGGFLPVPQQPRAPSGFDVEPAPPPASPSYLGPAPALPGILLTPGKLTMLAVFVVLLIGVAFFAGMLIG